MHLGFSSMNTLNDPNPAALAKTLEEAGFESLWYGEHSHIPMSRKTPYPPGGELPEPYKEMMDPYVSLMAAAAVTERLKIGTGIALLMERDIFSQAKTIATLDQLSNGRVIIGTGVGWNQEEFENVCPHPFKKRYSVLRETVLATRELLTKAKPEYHGEFVNFDPVWFEPKPKKPVNFLFGAMGPLGVKHAAEWADGWMPVDVVMPDVKKALNDFRDLVRANGRDPDALDITMVVMKPVTADLLKEYRDYGVTRCNIGVGMENWNKPEIIEPMINEFSKLIPQL
ncbi:MAG: LLM class F420-dependent oxidoreductase [Gammaproteobacteria bacterium]|nr:MAG: LLM class F420-dependent oxidoreductase [Gammaproteobacteria bacterium]